MTLRKREKEELYIMDYVEVSNEKLVDIYLHDMYAYIYVYRDGKLYSVLTKDDLPITSDNIPQRTDTFFIYSVENNNYKNADIIKKFQEEPELTRLAIACNDKVICEYNNGLQPALGKNVTKSLMAVRYLKVFQEGIYKEFENRNWKKVLVISESDIFLTIKECLPRLELQNISRLKRNHDLNQYDVVIDLLYGKKLRKLIYPSGNVLDLDKIVEGVALHELQVYCSKKGLHLLCCQLPAYEELTCLSEEELDNWKNPKNFRELVLNDTYMQKFSASDRDNRYLKNNSHRNTILFDNGLANIQSNCSVEGLKVENGIRKTVPEIKSYNREVHFFGTCSTFGICCPDEETIESLLQKSDFCMENGLKVFNHGGMYGRHLLNTIMLAMDQAVHSGDYLVLLDVFEGYGVNEVPGLARTAEWFNQDKSKEEIYFLDYPDHCNAKGNRIYADHIKKEIKNTYSSKQSGNGGDAFNYFSANRIRFDKMEYIDTTNANMYMHLKKLRDLRCDERKNGAVTMYAAPFTLGHKYLIDEALKLVDHLYVFVVADEFGHFHNLDRIEMVKSALQDYENVMVLPTESYFASNQFFPEYGNRAENLIVGNDVEFMEKINIKYVYKALNISVRIMGEERNDAVTAQYCKITEALCKKYHVEFVMIKRACVDGKEISAKTCRKLIHAGDFLELRKYLLPSVITYINNMKIDKIYRLILHKEVDADERKEIEDRLAYLAGHVEVYTKDDIPIEPANRKRKCIVTIHYGLDRDYSDRSSLDWFFESADELTDSYLKKLFHFVSISEKRILLYLGKFPAESRDIDGGSQLARQLIDSLKEYCQLDLVFIRKEGENYSDDSVNRIAYEEYLHPYDNKFVRRLFNINTNRSALMNHGSHDLLVAGHCSKFFGIEKEELIKRAVIFPMFLTSSYQRAGETVPREYTELETAVLTNVFKIITPSVEEAKDIIHDYQVPVEKVKVIPRGISSCMKGVKRKLDKENMKIVAIGSIKLQKNHLQNLKVLKILRERAIKIRFVLIGVVHDPEYYECLKNYIQDNKLENYVDFYHGITQQQISELLSSASFSISSSNWETFGRGIYEGFAAGLPTILSDRLCVVKNNVPEQDGVMYCENAYEMADKIQYLIENPKVYDKASGNVLHISQRFSYEAESEHLIREILFKSFEIESPFFPWELERSQEICSSRYSQCYRNGDRIRKYYRYDNRDKFYREFRYMELAYKNGNKVPKPMHFSYDSDNRKWYAESEFVPVSRMAESFHAEIYWALRKELEGLHKIRITDRDGWKVLLDEFDKALRQYSEKYQTCIQEEMDILSGLEQESFIHGDFLLKNIGKNADGYYIFDFQNSCMGPEEWDICYFLSEFERGQIEKSILFGLTKKERRLIPIILKIRIGRCLGRGESDEKLKKRLDTWERTE